MTSAGAPLEDQTGRVPFNRDAHAVQGHPASDILDAVVTLPPDIHSPSVARAFVGEHRDHLSAALFEDAVLLVSELVTNAVQHGRPAIALRVRSRPAGIGVAVSDDGPPIPDLNSPDLDGPGPQVPGAGATSGRGMAIVAAVADAWGVDPHVPPPGKTVWFELGAG